MAVADLASVIAEGELLHLFTMKLTRHTINYRLKNLETRMDSRRFGRGGPRHPHQSRRASEGN